MITSLKQLLTGYVIAAALLVTPARANNITIDPSTNSSSSSNDDQGTVSSNLLPPFPTGVSILSSASPFQGDGAIEDFGKNNFLCVGAGSTGKQNSCNFYINYSGETDTGIPAGFLSLSFAIAPLTGNALVTGDFFTVEYACKAGHGAAIYGEDPINFQVPSTSTNGSVFFQSLPPIQVYDPTKYQVCTSAILELNISGIQSSDWAVEAKDFNLTLTPTNSGTMYSPTTSRPAQETPEPPAQKQVGFVLLAAVAAAKAKRFVLKPG